MKWTALWSLTQIEFVKWLKTALEPGYCLGNLEYVNGWVCTMRWCKLMRKVQKSLPHKSWDLRFLNIKITAAGSSHFEKSRFTGIKHLVRGDKTQKSATHFRFFLYLTLGLNILTKHCRILVVMVCLYSGSERTCHDTVNLEQRRTLW